MQKIDFLTFIRNQSIAGSLKSLACPKITPRSSPPASNNWEVVTRGGGGHRDSNAIRSAPAGGSSPLTPLNHVGCAPRYWQRVKSARPAPTGLEKSRLPFEEKQIPGERRTCEADGTLFPSTCPEATFFPREGVWGWGHWGGTAHLSRTHTVTPTVRNLYLTNYFLYFKEDCMYVQDMWYAWSPKNPNPLQESKSWRLENTGKSNKLLKIYN